MSTKPHDIMETLAKQRDYKAGMAAATSMYTMRRDFGYVPPPLPPGGLPEMISDKEFEVMKDMKTLLKDATPDARKVILRKIEKDMKVDKRRREQERGALERERRRVRRILAALEEVEGKINASGLRLEKPPAPSFPDLRRAVSHSDAMYLGKDECKLERTEELDRRWEKEVFRHVNHFVVEHDWAAAFARADLGDFKLPYGFCAFDLHVSGFSVVGFAFQDDGDSKVGFSISVKSSSGWMLPPLEAMTIDDAELIKRTDGIGALLMFVAKQVRAVSIALDAEIAVTAGNRAPPAARAPGDNTLPPRSA